jgi:hypothetical protein
MVVGGNCVVDVKDVDIVECNSIVSEFGRYGIPKCERASVALAESGGVVLVEGG